MRYRDAINKGLNDRQTIYCGNYVVFHDPKTRKTSVAMFGNIIFTLNKSGKFSYDFCGYEGYSKTTRAINYCLEAVNAPFRVSTKKVKSKNTSFSKVIETYRT